MCQVVKVGVLKSKLSDVNLQRGEVYKREKLSDVKRWRKTP
jgi:hypothetical protein